MDRRSIGTALFGVFVGFFICCFVVYPPHARWNEGLDLGDVATWLSAVATMAAVVVALVISGRDQRRRDAERAADADIADFRAALLLQTSFANLAAVCIVVSENLGKYKATNQEIYFNFPDSPSIDELMRSEFEAVAGMLPVASGVSKRLAVPVLSTIAWSRHVVTALNQSVEEHATRSGGKFYILSQAQIRNLTFPIGVLRHFLSKANAEIDRFLGDAMMVPSEVLAEGGSEKSTDGH